tara:strand:- start:426 stop:599 length:174 start_codon:yes stop_codon:yes gene_type:complete
MLFKYIKEVEKQIIDKTNDLIKSTPEYKIGKTILEGDIDGEPTTADKYNKEWFNEKR